MSHLRRSGSPDISGTCSLIVRNITGRTSAADLFPLFSKYGEIVDIDVPRDYTTDDHSRGRGFAFVTYKNEDEAKKAIEVDGARLDGRAILVQFTKDRQFQNECLGMCTETVILGGEAVAEAGDRDSRPRSRSLSESPDCRPSKRKEIREEKIPEYLNIVSLLSSYGGDLIQNNGHRIALDRDTFKEKHVLVCYLHVPVIDSHDPDFWSLVNLCKELYSARKEKYDFEMVVVARMEDDDKEAFYHLLSRFPKSCLAVPFENWKRHDQICKILGLGRLHSVECVFVNADGKVSPFSSFKNTFADYGVEAFPFTKRIKEMDEECRRVVFEESNNLEAVLRCNDSSPAYVYKFGGVPEERLHISQLSNKHVGLLLCSRGDLIPHLVKRYEQCREKQLDFEVVVLCLPNDDCMQKMEPEILESLLYQHNNTCRRWWCLPFNDSVNKRFRRMTRRHSTRQFWDEHEQESFMGEGDKLIVVGPGVKHLDMYGGEVMKCQGIDGYPFTTEAVITNKIKKLQEFTLESLFAGTGVTRGDDRVVPVGELRANKVFLLTQEVDRDFDLKNLVPVYHEMKERFGYEMVLLDVGANLVPDEGHTEIGLGEVTYTSPITGRTMISSLLSDEERREMESEMPWYIGPVTKYVIELLRALRSRCHSLVGFGDDGRVCSLSEVREEISLRDFKPRNTALYDQVEKFVGYNYLGNRHMQHL